MSLYKVKIKETLEKDVAIEADDVTEAIDKATERYFSADSDYVLDYSNFKGYKIEVVDEIV